MYFIPCRVRCLWLPCLLLWAIESPLTGWIGTNMNEVFNYPIRQCKTLSHVYASKKSGRWPSYAIYIYICQSNGSKNHHLLKTEVTNDYPIQSRVPCLPSRGPYSTPTGRRSCQSTKWEGVCHLARKHTRTYGNLRPLLSWCLRTDPFSKKFKAGPSIWFKISAIKWFKEPSFIKDGSYQWLSHPE